MKLLIKMTFDLEENVAPRAANVEIIRQPDAPAANPEENANIAEPEIPPPVPAQRINAEPIVIEIDGIAPAAERPMAAAPVRRPRERAPDRRRRAGVPDGRPRAEAPDRRPRAGVPDRRPGRPRADPILRPPVLVRPLANNAREGDLIPDIPIQYDGVLDVAVNEGNGRAPPANENPLQHPQLPVNGEHANGRAPVPDVLEIAANVVVRPLCIICVEHEANMLLLPCAHYSTCEECFLGVNNGQCPVCRSIYHQSMKIYNAGFFT